jgi:hypothetical protein
MSTHFISHKNRYNIEGTIRTKSKYNSSQNNSDNTIKLFISLCPEKLLTVKPESCPPMATPAENAGL